MRYDLELAWQLCHEVGLAARRDSDDTIDVDLGHGTILLFQNAIRDDDCLMGLDGSPWHVHGDIIFADPRGYHVEMDYLNVLTGLAEGLVLVCERQVDGRAVELSLIHRDYNDEFKYLETNEQIVVRRAVAHAPEVNRD